MFLLISTLKRENVKEYTASRNIFPSILLSDFEPDSSSFNGLVIDNRETKMVLCFYLAVSKKSAPSAPMTRSATRGSVASGKSSYHLHLPCSSTNSYLLLFPCLALFLFLYKCPSLINTLNEIHAITLLLCGGCIHVKHVWFIEFYPIFATTLTIKTKRLCFVDDVCLSCQRDRHCHR